MFDFATDIVNTQRRQREKKIVNDQHVAILSMQSRLRAEVIKGNYQQDREALKLTLIDENSSAYQHERQKDCCDEKFLNETQWPLNKA